MTLIGIVVLVIIFAVIGFLVHLITTNVPMPAMFAQTIQVGVVVLLVIYLLGVITGHAPLPTLGAFPSFR